MGFPPYAILATPEEKARLDDRAKARAREIATTPRTRPYFALGGRKRRKLVDEYGFDKADMIDT